MVHKTKSSTPKDEFSTDGMIEFYGNIAGSIAGKVKEASANRDDSVEAGSMDGGHDA